MTKMYLVETELELSKGKTSAVLGCASTLHAAIAFAEAKVGHHVLVNPDCMLDAQQRGLVEEARCHAGKRTVWIAKFTSERGCSRVYRISEIESLD